MGGCFIYRPLKIVKKTFLKPLFDLLRKPDTAAQETLPASFVTAQLHVTDFTPTGALVRVRNFHFTATPVAAGPDEKYTIEFHTATAVRGVEHKESLEYDGGPVSRAAMEKMLVRFEQEFADFKRKNPNRSDIIHNKRRMPVFTGTRSPGSHLVAL